MSNSLDSGAEKWQVQLDPVTSGVRGTSDAKCQPIVAKASNLEYVSGPAEAENEIWWTSALEDEEAAKVLQQQRGFGEGGRAGDRCREGGEQRGGEWRRRIKGARCGGDVHSLLQTDANAFLSRELARARALSLSLSLSLARAHTHTPWRSYRHCPRA